MMRLVFSIIFIFVITLLAGCSSDQYTIEKEYWQAQKQAKKIFMNPHASPPKELERVVELHRSFIEKYPNINLSVDAEFNIARLYIVKEEFDKARAQLKTILDKYDKSKDISSEAVFLIGNSYEIEDKWSSALQQYKKIMQEYPVTLRGLDIPVYIAQHYKVKYQPDKMVSAFKEAAQHYKSLAANYPDSPFGFRVRTLVAQCYIALKDWQNAINSLDTIIDNYKDKIALDGILMDKALIYYRELEDKAKTKQILQQLIKDYPKSKLINTASNLLKTLEEQEQ